MVFIATDSPDCEDVEARGKDDRENERRAIAGFAKNQGQNGEKDG